VKESLVMSDDLRSQLDYEPEPLKFGTSGRRGRVVDLTQLEIYINALAELKYLQKLLPGQGGVVEGDDFFYGMTCGQARPHLLPSRADEESLPRRSSAPLLTQG